MSACKHVAGNMRSLLMDDEVKYISSALLQQLDRDLQECESESLSHACDYYCSVTTGYCFCAFVKHF